MSVELRELRWAIVAAQHRSLRQAANTLNIREPTLNRRLRDMESRLGAQLFERTNGGTSPTMVGREFLASAHHILTETDSALRKLKARSRGEIGRLTIGVYASLSTGNLHATLTEHRRKFPDVELFATDGDHDQLLCALSNNVVDVAIMTSTHGHWGDRTISLWSERVILALHERHPLSQSDAIHWRELANAPLPLPQYGPGPELERLLTIQLPSAIRGEFTTRV